MKNSSQFQAIGSLSNDDGDDNDNDNATKQ